ncbi:MAG: DUF72 domain-containing protein [Chloroflexi bacterium]|nr:DUF72 domain-containing protein [Chloroflexota bacterium]
MTHYLVGTSGYTYDHWRHRFYSPEVPKSRWLPFYAQYFSTVELNNPFYRLPSEKAFENWREIVPPPFVFAVKVSRFITHIKRLRNAQESLSTFLNRVRLLEEKTGPLLYQLPPTMRYNPTALASFLALLPSDMRHVFEFRHPSWLKEDIFALLRQHNVAFCIMDMTDFPCPIVTTADFAYMRFHGSAGKYMGCYSESDLAEWAARIKALGVPIVYIYFNNDAEAFAVRNALALEQLLSSA